MKVLSLFDGMSCGQIALKELGIIPNVYYASEIDKHAIGQTQLNFPNTIQVGSVVDVDVTKLQAIDLLLGGSPCQSFSFAGKQKGMTTKCEIEILKLEQYLELKEQGFEFEGQSYLFWEYVRILTDIRKYNPNVLFLLENVEMSKKWERVLSEALGLFGVHINSALVSAQNRERIYWSNIRVKKQGFFSELYTDIPQPKDLGLVLGDILESEVDEKYYLSERSINRLLNSDFYSDCRSIDGKIKCVVSREFAQQSSANYIKIKEGTSKGFLEINPGECFDFENPKSVTRRGRKMGEKSNCLMAKETDFMQYTQNHRIRRLTPTECARLQTIPDWYKWECSDTQQYKMCGNGWTINVIKHILSFI